MPEKMRVLLTDDEERFAQSLAKILRNRNMEVHTARDGGIEGRRPIARGDWIVRGAVPPPARRIDTRLRVVDPRPLNHWTPVHVHLGAADVLGRVAVLESAAIAPGESGLVQLVLEQPIGAVRGDGFIVRDQSSRRTLGGGTVIDVFPPPRGRAKPERLAWLAAMALDDDAAALRALLAQAPAGVDLARFAANRNLRGEDFFSRVPMKVAAGLGFAPEAWSALRVTRRTGVKSNMTCAIDIQCDEVRVR